MSERRTVRFYPDWHAWPLWVVDEDGWERTAGRDELLLSGDLKVRIATWAGWHDAQAENGYDFRSAEERARFEAEWASLHREVQAELGDDYLVAR